MNALRTLSTLMERAGIALRAGITFGGKRDLYAVLGYQRELRVADFRARYERGGIAARVVDAYPTATWRGGAEVYEDEDPKALTDFEEQWDELDERLHLWPTFERLDILAGLGRYAVLLIGMPGPLEEPAPRLSGPDDILYCLPYAEDEARVRTVERNTENPRFGYPTTYQIKRRSDLASFSVNVTIDRVVHWSRVIHVADMRLEDRLVGRSRMARVWNNLDDLDKVVGGGAEAFWRRAHQGYFFNIDGEADISDPELAQMKDHAEEFAHDLRRTMALRGTDVKVLGSDVANFGPAATSILSFIAGTTGIPQRILLGSERGELASTQDKENWDTRVQDRRQSFAEPEVVDPFIERLIELGALPEPEDFYIKWPDIQDIPPDERANIADKLAGLNSKAGGTVILPEEIREQYLGLEPLTPEQKARIEQEKQDALKAQQEAMAGTAGDGKQPPADKNAPPVQGRAASTNRPKDQTHAAVRRVAAKTVPKLKALLKGAILKARREIDRVMLEKALAQRHHGSEAEAAFRPALARMQGVLQARVRDAVESVMVSAGRATAYALPHRAKPRALRSAVELSFTFDQTNSRAIAYARSHSAELITDITGGTRDLIQSALQSVFEDTISIRQGADRIRELVGLTERQAQAAENLYDRIIDSAGERVFAGDREIDVPDDVTAAFAQAEMDRYADDLLDQRVDTIARTETSDIANSAQQLTWMQASDEGLLNPDDARVWFANPECVDPLCLRLDGTVAAIDEPFVDEDTGEEYDNPPAHPNCECGQGLVAAEELTAAQLRTCVGGKHDIPFASNSNEYKRAYYQIWKQQKAHGKDAVTTSITPEGHLAIHSPSGIKIVKGPASGSPSTPKPAPSAAPVSIHPTTKVPAPAPAPEGPKQYPGMAPIGTPGTTPLSTAEFNAVRGYQGSYYSEINGYLRRNDLYDPNLSKSSITKVAHLDAVMSRVVPFTAEQVVQRGTTGEFAKQIWNSGVGSVFHDKGYVSTSKEKGFGGATRFIITLPVGSRGLDMNFTLGKASLHRGEHEILLPRDSRFRVTKLEKNVINPHLPVGGGQQTIHIIHAELLT